MTAREILKILRKDGWYEHVQNSSHVQLKHPVKKGKVTVPFHKGEDLYKGTLGSILSQAGLVNPIKRHKKKLGGNNAKTDLSCSI